MSEAVPNWIFALLVGALAAGAATPLMRRVSPLLGWTDRVVSTAVGTPMARGGGAAVAIAWAIAWGLAGSTDSRWFALAIPAAGAFALVTHDDFVDSSPRMRLGALAALAILAAGLGLRAESLLLPGLEPIALGPAAVPLSALWILGVTVAFDFIDGLDGLASGLAILALSGLLLLPAGGSMAVPIAGLLGALLAFQAFNHPPASIYLGDAGSNLVGFAVGGLTLLQGQISGTLPVLPVLLLIAIPVLDAVLTLLRRAKTSSDLFASDLGHLHHRLLRAGGSPPAVLGILLGCGALSVWAAVESARMAPTALGRAVALGAATSLAGLAVFSLRFSRQQPSDPASPASSPDSQGP